MQLAPSQAVEMHSVSLVVLLLLAWRPATSRGQEVDDVTNSTAGTGASVLGAQARDSLECPAVCPSCPGCPACPSAPACPRHIPPGYKLYEPLGYYKMHYEYKNWTEAKAACEREGGYLAVLNSEDEASLASSFMNKYNISDKMIIGWFDVTENGRYITVLDDPVSSTGYEVWASGEPNHVGKENCGTLNPNKGLNDEACTSAKPFLCELFT